MGRSCWMGVKGWIILCSVIGLLSCAGGPGEHEQIPWVFEPITGMETVSGKWQGVLKRVPENVDDWVKVVISEDGGYQFATYRTIGVFKGEGRFSLVEGRLKAESERGTIGGALYRAGDRRLLKIRARSHDGNDYAVNLTPAP
ncbi:MAG TPA: hypothetical protein VLA99_01255 [Nitrospiraceae bacterium]|nr:hypothetical protein [Nitrospiraceae bacterium]